MHENRNVLRPLTSLRHSQSDRAVSRRRGRDKRPATDWVGPPPIPYKTVSLLPVYLFRWKASRGNGSCITVTRAPYGNKKTEKHQNGDVKRTSTSPFALPPPSSSCLMCDQNGKSETFVLNLDDDARGKKRILPWLGKKQSLHLFIDDDNIRSSRNASIAERIGNTGRRGYNNRSRVFIETKRTQLVHLIYAYNTCIDLSSIRVVDARAMLLVTIRK